MTDTATTRPWVQHLNAEAGGLPAASTTTADVYRALALAWHTSGAVDQPASVVTELGWMRLAETLYAAWVELATVVDPPAAVPFEAGTRRVAGSLDDTEQLRDAAARLVRATAAALRRHSAQCRLAVDAALALAGIAADLDAGVEGWP